MISRYKVLLIIVVLLGLVFSECLLIHYGSCDDSDYDKFVRNRAFAIYDECIETGNDYDILIGKENPYVCLNKIVFVIPIVGLFFSFLILSKIVNNRGDSPKRLFLPVLGSLLVFIAVLVYLLCYLCAFRTRYISDVKSITLRWESAWGRTMNNDYSSEEWFEQLEGHD